MSEGGADIHRNSYTFFEVLVYEAGIKVVTWLLCCIRLKCNSPKVEAQITSEDPFYLPFNSFLCNLFRSNDIWIWMESHCWRSKKIDTLSLNPVLLGCLRCKNTRRMKLSNALQMLAGKKGKIPFLPSWLPCPSRPFREVPPVLSLPPENQRFFCLVGIPVTAEGRWFLP